MSMRSSARMPLTLSRSFRPGFHSRTQGGPNFYRFGDSVLYEFKIDNNGDGVEDITYQFRFTIQVKNPNTFLYATGPIKGLDDASRNFTHTYTVTRIESGRSSSPPARC